MSTCQNPSKIKHRSHAAALKALRSLEAADRGSPDMSIYRCGDHWHIGHNVVKFSRRIRAALRRSA